ncbi:kinase-like domain-containing protein [Gigaspora rosea]|uniref:Kinase-like domain-containing protein n=1 Tax=Gigaspora rosea TaxID=44941 RepID=A0A397VMR2_9GLOM|nr:kinase-like domain-containing protein [Gigaspora rosea]
MNWKDKLNLLQCIASDLQIIHSHDLIHRDLHSGNILLNSVKSAYIADLGLLISVNSASISKSDRICGILPYIAPEVFENKQYTKASDIYSFGIIMWEVLYGKPITFELKSKAQSELQFQMQICNGLRPHIYENTPKCCADLMKRCWNIEAKGRPTATEICDIFAEWHYSEIILSKLSVFDKNLQNIKNEDVQIYIEPNEFQGNYDLNFFYKKINTIILHSNRYLIIHFIDSELYSLKIPDTIS